MVYGVLSISNGVDLKYPFPLVMKNLSGLCDKVIVGLDPAFPQDFSFSENYLKENNLTNVDLIPSPWNKTHIEDGLEVAMQMEMLVGAARLRGSKWVVVPQADELFLESDFPAIRHSLATADPLTIGFSTERLYFWKDFDVVRKDWSVRLVRIFRPEAFSFTAAGTDKAGMYSAPILPGITIDLPQKMYHYSRMGNPKDISRRIRNLDGYFHQDSELVPFEELPEYDFIPRKFDNYVEDNPPEKVEGVFENYLGPHPLGIKEWFEEKK